MKLPRTIKFINRICFELTPSCGDFVTRCKGCGKAAWVSTDIKHKLNCEVKMVLKELAKEAENK